MVNTIPPYPSPSLTFNYPLPHSPPQFQDLQHSPHVPHLQFDTLPTGSPVPSDYPVAGATWLGWTVQSGSSLTFNATSSPNVIQSTNTAGSTTPGAFITYVDGNAPFTVISLESFSFSCGYFFEAGEMNVPTDCSIIVVGAQDLFESSSMVSMAGPFSFTAAADSGQAQAMVEVTSDMLAEIGYVNVISFYIVGGLSTAYLLLDDVVVKGNLIDC